LSTVEYAILLVLIAAVSLAAWRLLGASIKGALGLVDERFSLLLEDSSLDESGPGDGKLSGGGKPAVGGGSNAGGGSSAGGAGGKPSAGSAGAGGASGAKPAPTTGLGADIDKVVAQSPKLRADITKLQNAGWTIKYGTAGGGSFTRRKPPEIIIDPNDKAKAAAAAQSIAHEAGHALNPVNETSMSGLTREQFIKQASANKLSGEGSATLSNLEAREQILANGGADIGIAGTQDAKYEKIYKDYKAGKLTREQAKQQIAQVYGANEKTSNTKPPQSYQTYWETAYAKEWDRKYAGKPKTFVAP
jgi:type VI secretion system secreted protein VgrG